MNSRPQQTISELLEILALGTGEPGNLAGTLQLIAQTAHKLFSTDICIIFAINPITGRFLSAPTLAGDLRTANKIVLEPPGPDGIAQRVLDQGSLFVEDLEAQPRYKSTFTHLENIHSFAAVSLYTKHPQKSLAVLYLDFKQPHQFSLDERNWLQLFTTQASSVLQNTWFLRRYQEVAHIGQEINQELATVEILFEKLQEHVSSILDTSHFFMLATYRPQTNSLDLFIREKGKYLFVSNEPVGGGCQWVLKEKKPLVIHHFSEETDRLPTRLVDIPGTDPEHSESIIFVPLTLREVPLGVLSVQHPNPFAYNYEDLRILELLGSQVALALSSMRLFENLSELNETGQFLTQRLDSVQALQDVVDRVRNATKADLVILYPYEQAGQLFAFPCWISGDLLQPNFPRPNYSRPDDVASLTLHQTEPVFVKNSSELYAALGGNASERKVSFGKREQIRSTAAVPLRVGEESVGVLFVNFRQPQRFDAPQKHLIQGLASYAAIAIKNSREFGALTHRRVRELELLQEIDREISTTLDLQRILQTILELTIQHIPADKAAIFLYNARTQMLEKQAAVGRDTEASPLQKIPLNQEKGITHWVFEHRMPARVDNVRYNPNWRDVYIEATSDILSELDVPLWDDEEIVGVINLESVKEGAFSQADQDFLVTLASHAALAIKNAQAYEQQKRTVNELSAVQEIGREIVSQWKFKDVLETILEKALQITGSTFGQILLYDTQRNDLYSAVERGVLPEKLQGRLPKGRGIPGFAIEHKQLLNVDVRQPPWNEIYEKFIPDAHWELAVPLLEKYEPRGVINIERPSDNPFTERDERLLTALADLAVIAIQNAERYEKAEERGARLSALHQVDQKIISQLDDPDQVIRDILENALALTGAESGSLSLYEGDVLGTTYFASTDDQGQLLPIRRMDATDASATKILRGITTQVAETRRAYRTLGNVQNDPLYAGDVEIHSQVAVPLLLGSGELIGVLNLESRRHHAFDDDDVEVLELFANQAVIAIQTARNRARAEEEARRFQLLHQAGQELGEITDLTQLEQAYDIVIQIAATHSQSQIVIHRYDADAQELVLVRAVQRSSTPPFAHIKLNEGINGRVARERRTIVVSNVDSLSPNVFDPKLSEHKMQSLVVVPIQIEDYYYGNLSLSHDKANYFKDADVKLIEGLARQLAITIHRLETVQARQEAEQRAITAEVMSSIGQQSFELAHRLGNDLGLVKSYVNNIKLELAAQDVVSTSVESELDKIVRDVRRVLDLSTRLKQELGDFRSGEKPSIERMIVPTRVLLEETTQSISPPSNVQIRLEVANDVASVYVVHSQVADILRNLAVNAIEAMPEEGGVITLRGRNAGRYVEMEVEDTGIGISLQRQSRIFDLFYSTKGSSGFGLWSARRNALADGGDLTVKSQPGQGTTFTLLLPRAEEERTVSNEAQSRRQTNSKRS